MKYTKHILCGIAVGLVQYLLITGFSYASVILPLSVSLSSALMIGAHVLILFVAGWNVFYEVGSVATLFVRVFASIGAYILAWFVCVHFEVILSLEKWLGLGSTGANAQGLIALSFYSCLLLAGIIMIALKCVALSKGDE
jgi:hypothetical protein